MGPHWLPLSLFDLNLTWSLNLLLLFSAKKLQTLISG